MTTTFQEFLSLTEAGKDPIKIKWNKASKKWTSTFSIKDVEYNIEAYVADIETNFEIWEFKFYKDKITTQITGDFKTHFILVPTISKAFEEFVQEVKPDCVVFLASDKSRSRKSLYKQNADSISAKYNYFSVNPYVGDNDILFGICKRKDMIEEIRKLIGL